MKKILYIDMDGVICDFVAGINSIDSNVDWDSPDAEEIVTSICQCNPHIFLNLPRIEGAKESIDILHKHYDIYFASSPMWSVPQSYMDKRVYIHKMFKWAWKRLILTHHKGLLHGDFLIDDRIVNGVDSFTGTHIHFGQGEFTNWTDGNIVKFLIENA